MDQSEIEDIRKKFSSSNAMIRSQMARKAIEYGNLFIPNLRLLLDDPFYETRVYAIRSLAILEDIASINKISTLLFDEVEECRYQAAWALGKLNAQNKIPDLINALGEAFESRETRRMIAKTFSKFDQVLLKTRFLEFMREFKKQDFAQIDSVAILKVESLRGLIELLPNLPLPNIDDIIEQILKFEDLETRRILFLTISALGLLKYHNLIHTYQDNSDDDVRLSAFTYCLHLEDEQIKKISFYKAIDDKYEWTRVEAVKYLPTVELTDEEIEKLIFLISQDKNENPRIEICKIIHLLSMKAIILCFELFSKDKHFEVRHQLAKSISKIDKIDKNELISYFENEKDGLIKMHLVKIKNNSLN